ncbi:mannonate dehydratase [Salipiger sp. IMCC34102]|uniref:mannonate dehydratase n=1 Tax=Salipiger sp. IMCC34102 TaxID=2510647 RepID=UPI00101BBEA9|nr:mannonate dehydratase [Salipiger sp. IMCC34102]RYH03520.1 mannonate dehydratase [Salipiger sp. IMCC34102]
MKETWRWFGPADEIAIPEIVQTGATGIVSALHHIAPGAVWSPEEIATRKAQIEGPAEAPSGLSWDVVESLPVSEAIKTQTGDWRTHLQAYRESLAHLAQAGLQVICYNFMPVLDWTRTDLAARQPNGGTAMAFDLVDFAVFDLHLLGRADAGEDYGAQIKAAAERRAAEMDDAVRVALTSNIVAGLPGANDRWTLDDVRAHLATYDRISPDRLRQNLIDFLAEVAPTAQDLGLRLCCHPDDPPFPLLGLPRVMSTIDDYAAVLDAVDLPSNGATLCTGSLGVDAAFDPVAFVRRHGPRIHFVHLRNTTRTAPDDGLRTSFHESEHLAGDTDMIATIAALLDEEARRRAEGRVDAQIPMRPDHGHALLSDFDRPMMPGYPLIGRLRGLAELRGAMAALSPR